MAVFSRRHIMIPLSVAGAGAAPDRGAIARDRT